MSEAIDKKRITGSEIHSHSPFSASDDALRCIESENNTSCNVEGLVAEAMKASMIRLGDTCIIFLGHMNLPQSYAL